MNSKAKFFGLLGVILLLLGLPIVLADPPYTCDEIPGLVYNSDTNQYGTILSCSGAIGNNISHPTGGWYSQSGWYQFDIYVAHSGGHSLWTCYIEQGDGSVVCFHGEQF